MVNSSENSLLYVQTALRAWLGALSSVNYSTSLSDLENAHVYFIFS